MVSINLDGEGDEFVVLNLDESGAEEGNDNEDDDGDSGYDDYEEEVTNPPTSPEPTADNDTDDDDILVLNETEADTPDTINERRTPINVYPDPTLNNPNPEGDDREIDQIHQSEFNHILNEKPDYIKYPGGKLPSPTKETAKNGPHYLPELDYPLSKDEQEEYKQMYVNLFDHCDQCKKELEQEREVIGLLRHQYVHVRSQIIMDGVKGDIHKEPRILDSFSMHIATNRHTFSEKEDRPDYWNNPKFYEKLEKTAKSSLKYKFPFDIFESLDIGYELKALAIQYENKKGKVHTIPCRGARLTSMAFEAPRHVQTEGEWGGFTHYEAFSGSFTVIFKCTPNLAQAETLRFKPADYAFARRIKGITESEITNGDLMITLGKLLLAFGTYREDNQFPAIVPKYNEPLSAKCDPETEKDLNDRDQQKSTIKYYSRSYPQKSDSSSCRRKSATDGDTPSKKSKKEKPSRRSSKTRTKTSKSTKEAKSTPKLLSKGTRTLLSASVMKSERDEAYSDMRKQYSTEKKSTKSTDDKTTSSELTKTNGSEKLVSSTQPQYREASPYQYLSGLRINRGRLTAHSRLGQMSYTGPTTMMTGAINGYTTYSQARPMMRSSTYLNTLNSYGNYNSSYKRRYKATPSQSMFYNSRQWPRLAYKEPPQNWRKDNQNYKNGSEEPLDSGRDNQYRKK